MTDHSGVLYNTKAVHVQEFLNLDTVRVQAWKLLGTMLFLAVNAHTTAKVSNSVTAYLD